MRLMGRIEWMRQLINTRRAEEGGDFYDPNAGIDPEVRDWAARLSLFPFENARVLPEGIAHHGVDQHGFVAGQTGKQVHLVYVRVTLEDEQEEGTGPIPGILIDWAREMRAEPHVVRIHFRSQSEGTAIEYFGHDQLQADLQAGDWFLRKLLRGRTARDCLRLVGGCPSKLELQIRRNLPGEPPERDLDPELLAIFGAVDVPAPEERAAYRGYVSLGMRVDTLPHPRVETSFLSLGALLRSTHLNDEHFIFTCSCGAPQCSDIWSGVDTVHEDGLLVWRLRSFAPRRLVVFDRDQYREEILTKVRAALVLQKEMGPDVHIGAGESRERIESALFVAEEAAA